jgi:hypothetical protein
VTVVEINPYETRLRIQRAQDQVQMQREAAPDDDTAGCAGCPYFWTCDVPHRAARIDAPQELDVDLDDVAPRRGAFRPLDASDIPER